ncbi:transcriptional regulator with XRE-family HTH domain [Allocatelliglobosispora scoriae]|uniref:Transcriptional regulator with XRE-family HTH domain n=1 Tax=Allocatelliglobosispora scoriae TaxID=643052 RepID=A0A841C3C2_9ACTN|nr:helix-turn-helix transcriptional regulator [Allocatelliglobosispora scoriae]MBB5873450.1 transcriptional regulator with XRE-family HTH domain [Allocatelliglobosispora scoriae]
MSDGLQPQFGAEMRRRRHRAGLSLDVLAARVHYSKGYLSRIENGDRRPHTDLARLVDGELQADGELIALAERRDEAVVPPLPTGPDAHWPELDDVAPPGAARARSRLALPADPATLTAFTRVFGELRELSQLVPAEVVTPSVIDLCEKLSRAAHSADPEQRGSLFRHAARYAEFAGWMLQESGADREALQWTRRAVQLAHAGGDSVMGTHSLIRRALFALVQRESATVVELATRAARTDSAPPWLRSFALQRAAQGHALAGHADLTLRALEDAQKLLDSRSADDPVAKLGPGSVADPFTMTFGWCLSDLGKLHRAAEIFDRETARIPVQARRTRARYGVRRSIVHALNGEIDHACVIAEELLPDIAAVQSATTDGELRRLNRILIRHRGHRRAQQLAIELNVTMSYAR